MGKRTMGLGVLTMVLSTVMLLESTNAATYVVGDSLGWTVPPSASTYANWASQHNFVVGDVLVFNFPSGAHDVARVSKAAFDGCNPASPIGLITIGPANVTLNSLGQEYFFCTFGQHCLAGQKLAINVSAATTPSPAPTPSHQPPSPSPIPTPSPSPSPIQTPSPSPIPTPPSPSPEPSPPSPTPAPEGGASPPGSAPPSGPLVPPPSGSGSSPPSGSELPPPGGVSPPSPNSAPTMAGVSTFVIFVSIAFGIMF